MRVALDFRMANHTGIGTYLRSLLPHLSEADPDLEVLLLIPDDVAPPSPLPPRVERARWADAPEVYSRDEQWAFSGLEERFHFDLLHVPHFQAPVLAGPPMVVTIHDLVFLRFPEECPSYAHHLYARAMMPLVARRARRLLAVSETVARDVVERLGVPRHKVLAARSGAPPVAPVPEDAEALREKHGVKGRYLLSVGMQRPRKNLVRLVEAYQSTGLADEGVQLVLAGPTDPRGAEVGVAIRRHGLVGQVLQTGFLEQDDLAALYEGAEGLVNPALYEGFGFSPLEAWGYGLPVAASTGGALPEVCGDAAESFSPEDVAGMAAALRVLVTPGERRSALIQAGRDRREQLTWTMAAEQTARAYREALGIPHHGYASEAG
jgi:glycosyltransferase involved in cell wall biosynthesis